ncbi:hypothetical protein, partial [Nocardia miyunensis]|uniref:hypothetical protein n=1 Tax=Nocardia miyunensis TaxID=282684 RepID=UPI000A85FF40
MATDSSTADDTGWSNLSTSASDGQLMLESGIAEKCAQHVETMLNAVVGVINWIGSNYKQASPAIAETSSGEQLAEVFREKFQDELKSVLEQHRSVLTDMGNTFVSAGKQYASSEGESTESFEDISFDGSGATSPSGSAESQTIPSSSTTTSSSGTKESLSITPEQGSSFSWQQLYSIGQSIKPQDVADAGGVWYWLAKDLAGDFSTLESSIESAENDWTGSGASAAVSATKKYVQAADLLTTDMNKIGDVLVSASHWLQQTKNSMPTTANPPTTSGSGYSTSASDIAAETEPYQNAFTQHYTDSFSSTSDNILVLPEPSQTSDSSNGSSGSSGSSGSGSDGSSGDSSSGPSGSRGSSSDSSSSSSTGASGSTGPSSSSANGSTSGSSGSTTGS